MTCYYYYFNFCTPSAYPGCPKGQDIVPCFVDPCQFASCPSFPHALCVADHCGGCNARFFLQGGKEVTDKCGKVELSAT